MTAEYVIGVFYEAMKLCLLLTAPALLSGLVAGVLVSLFQAATQINEMTLVFIPKMLAVAVALLLTAPWMIQLLVEYTQAIYASIPLLGR